MESFVHVAGWGHSARHVRSMSSVPAGAATQQSSPPSSPKAVDVYEEKAAASSTTALPISPNPSSKGTFDDDMTTLPDPRSRTSTPARRASPADPAHGPDINEEVTALSTKLINAINHQTHLDDTLSATRHDLEAANDRIRELEAKNASQREILSGDVWIRRTAVENEKKSWQAQIAEERALRLETEREKKKIEQELENLTAALFEEANKMVIRAKEQAHAEHEVLQRKNDQLKLQLAESESLLNSQQEQLSELKHVVETMASDRDDQTTTNPTAPSSPGIARFDPNDEDRFPSVDATASPMVESVCPAHPTSFSHLIQPIMRNDLAAYEDFVSLIKLSRVQPGSRVSTGSLAGLGLPSLGLAGTQSSSHAPNGSTGSLNVGQPHNNSNNNNNSAPQSPNTPASTASASSPTSTATMANLKDTKFYKRVLSEDIEPTLRLDAAPGLSWLARRSVVSAVTDGSLVVDPVVVHAGNSFIMSITKPQYNPCSLCGESRNDPRYLRNHRFRTSEQDSAQRYPLCKYCLGRVRSTCDFLGFLRMVKDGHWRAEDDDQEKAAYEESVRLREQMFWARVGGGVIPCGQAAAPAAATDGDKSRRPSHEHHGKSEESSPREPGPEELGAHHEAKDGQESIGPDDAEAPAATEPAISPPVEKPSTPPTQTDEASRGAS